MQGVLDIIKKNLLSLIAGVVALIAIIALSTPLSGMYQKFQSDLTTRAGDYGKADGLVKAKRPMPIVSVGETATYLSVYPNPQAIAEAGRARDAVAQQAKDLSKRVLDLNRAGHTLLFSDTILPNPGDRVFDYRKYYVDEINRQIPARLGAVAPPTPDEIKTATEQLRTVEVENKIILVGGKELNRDQLERDFGVLAAELPAKLRKDRATQYQLYMEPGAISFSAPMFDVNRKPLPADVWYAQLGLWIQGDVIDSIVSANKSVLNGNILSNPIKRLVKLDVPHGPAVYLLAPGAAPNGPQGASSTLADDGTGRDYTRSPTGRYSNSVYDVVQYALTLDVDQRYVPLVLSELQRNKLTTVTGVDITALDPAGVGNGGNPAAAAAGSIYDFGTAPMVELNLTLESLYFRSWTKPYMPEEVKLDLKIPPEAGEANVTSTGGTGAGSGGSTSPTSPAGSPGYGNPGYPRPSMSH